MQDHPGRDDTTQRQGKVKAVRISASILVIACACEASKSKTTFQTVEKIFLVA